MQNTAAIPAHPRELNTLAWVVFAGALLMLTVSFIAVRNRQHIETLIQKARAARPA